MKYNTQKSIKSILAIFLLIFAFVSISTSVSASELSKQSVRGSSYDPENYQPYQYVSIVKYYDADDYVIPPSTYYMIRIINGIRYQGTLSLYSYAFDPDINKWIATYKGYIYPFY